MRLVFCVSPFVASALLRLGKQSSANQPMEHGALAETAPLC
jgi:hypothetical protein